MSNESQDLNQSKFGRYWALLILIALFLVLIFTTAAITFYSTYQLEKSTQTLKVIVQQGISVQRLSKNILNIDIVLDEALHQNPVPSESVAVEQLPQHAWSRIDDVEKQQMFFEAILEALKNGGEITAPNGERFTVQPITDKALLQTIYEIESTWLPYVGLLKKFNADTQKKVVRKKTIQPLVDYTRLHDEELQIQINGIATGLYQLTQTQTLYLRYMQMASVLSAILLFLAVIFGALRRLAKKDKVLENARHEVYEIMRTVDTGLFLLDKDLIIGNQHSEALVDILGVENLAGESLSNILRNRVSAHDLKTAEEFLEQLYRPHVKEKLVKSLNPLHKVMIHDPRRPGESRYLDFRFSRVYENKEISSILVNVNDVSEAVRLEKRLEKERADNDMRIEMLTSILNTSPKTINEFIQNTYMHIDKMNAILRNPGSSQFELENKLMSIYREMHTLKGEASSLRLHSFTKIASDAEDKLYAMQNQGKLSGNDFLSLAVFLDDLFRLTNTIANLGERMTSVLQETEMMTKPEHRPADTSVAQGRIIKPIDNRSHQTDAKAQLGNYLASFAQDIAARQGKSVQVDISQMQGKTIPERLSAVVKEICIQLLRNAIVHGIAEPQVRIQRGKSPTGTIKIALAEYAGEQKDSLIFAVEDDGQGIDYNAIRARLRQSNMYPADKIDALAESQLLNALFSSGFTTKQVADEDGGRGVGLDLVKARVKEFGGKINVQSQTGQFARFIIKLPMV